MNRKQWNVEYRGGYEDPGVDLRRHFNRADELWQLADWWLGRRAGAWREIP